MGRTTFPAVVGVAVAVAAVHAAAWAGESRAHDEITDVRVVVPPLVGNLDGQRLDAGDVKSLRAATSDTASLLRGVPGLSLYGAGGVSSLPALHGLGDDRLRIRVDGMDLVSACGNHMNPPLSYMPPAHVGTIQVLPGVTPVSVGGDSIGGTIVVDSPAPVFAAAGGNAVAKGEMGGFYRANSEATGLNLALDGATEQLSVRYSGSYARAENYRAASGFKDAAPAASDRPWLEGDAVGSSGFETQNHKLGLAWQGERDLLQLEAGYQHIPYQGFANQRMDMLDNTSLQLGVGHTRVFDWGELRSRAYREHTGHSMNFGPDKQYWYGDAPGMPMETEGTNYGLSVAADLNLSDTDLLRMGADIQFYDLDDWWPPAGSGMMMAPHTFWNIRDGKRNRVAAYLEWQGRPSRHWQMAVGGRYEAVHSDAGEVSGYSSMYAADAAAFNRADRSRRDDNWDFSAQLAYRADDNQAYQLGIARKTRSPNLYERYSWSTVGMAMRMVNMAGDGNGYVGNLALTPEIAHTLSGSADWHDSDQSRWQVTVTSYYTLVDDYIDAAPCTAMMCNMVYANPGFRYLTFRNDDARLYGVDVSGSLSVGRLDSLGDLSLSFVASHVRGENRTTGDNLYNIMPLNGTFELQQRGEHWQNSLEWQVVAGKSDIAAVRNEVPTAGYGLLNMRTTYQWQDMRFDLGVENLLDKAYRLPLGGAYVGQGPTMAGTAVPWGVAVPGPGRSLYLGASYSF